MDKRAECGGCSACTQHIQHSRPQVVVFMDCLSLVLLCILTTYHTLTRTHNSLTSSSSCPGPLSGHLVDIYRQDMLNRRTIAAGHNFIYWSVCHGLLVYAMRCLYLVKGEFFCWKCGSVWERQLSIHWFHEH